MTSQTLPTPSSFESLPERRLLGRWDHKLLKEYEALGWSAAEYVAYRQFVSLIVRRHHMGGLLAPHQWALSQEPQSLLPMFVLALIRGGTLDSVIEASGLSSNRE